MGLDEWRARLDSLLAGQGHAADRRARAAGLHDALIEFKTALAENRDALAAAERELASERRQLEDATRRGGLAAGIGDTETARIAEEFAGRHRERAAILERKEAVIRDEIAYMEREYETLKAQYQTLRQTGGLGSAPAAEEPSDREFDALRARADRAAAEQAAQAQLELLKKKLGKQ
ncbi:MAG TPA: hypothetical protein VF187_05480 [Gemmatimonadales bacterium]